MKLHTTTFSRIKTQNAGRPLWFRLCESALLAVICATAVIRVTFIEAPHVEPPTRTLALSNEAVSLLISSVYWGAAAIWVVLCAAAGRLRWRRTFAAKAIVLFSIIGLTGVWFASDKRAALTDWAVLLSGPLAGLLAIQLLDSREKVRLFLWLLMAVGAASTYACYDKMSSSDDLLIHEYERNPQAFLKTLGIEPGSIAQWHYEHRLYSRDVSGFLTTGNSTGSFLLLAIFAGTGLCLEAVQAHRRCRAHQDRRGAEETLVALLCLAGTTALSLAGLLMTQSKGAIGAFFIGLAALTGCVLLRKTLWTYRRWVAMALIAAAFAATVALIAYGTRHGRLPGGNSMLVRWQYWVSSVEIAKESPLLGVGGGNFASCYLTHKDPAAPETIGDPHNWVLSLLCRFGLIGLAAMGVALLRPLVRLFAAGLGLDVAPDGTSAAADTKPIWAERYLWAAILTATLAAMVLVRPVLLELNSPHLSTAEWSAAFLLLVVIPAAIIALVFGLLRFACVGDRSLNQPNIALLLALGCGLAAMLLHNLVDFALFEPGIWTMFWLTMAAACALVRLHTNDQAVGVYPLTDRFRRGGMLIAAAAVIAAVVGLVVLPPIRRDLLTFAAARAESTEQAEAFLKKAVAADVFSPDAAHFGARLLLHRATQRFVSEPDKLLESARRFAEIAVARNPIDPRPRQLLADILLVAAEMTKDETQKRMYQQHAFQTLKDALKRYPGSDIINYQLGVLAEELGHPNQAIEYLQTALDIEQRYRKQFQLMYPEQPEVISRLGPRRYQDLLERLERLRHDQP